jgi:hypothetical protein
MILRLYEVSTTVTAVVLATSELEAEKLFKSDFGDIISDQGIDAQADCEISDAKSLPDDWDTDCMPYGPHGNTLNIGQCLDLVPPPVVRDKKTIDMFAADPSNGKTS